MTNLTGWSSRTAGRENDSFLLYTLKNWAPATKTRLLCMKKYPVEYVLWTVSPLSMLGHFFLCRQPVNWTPPEWQSLVFVYLPSPDQAARGRVSCGNSSPGRCFPLGRNPAPPGSICRLPPWFWWSFGKKTAACDVQTDLENNDRWMKAIEKYFLWYGLWYFIR